MTERLLGDNVGVPGWFMAPRRGVYPGSFNPLTLAHLEIATVARRTHRLDRIDLALSVDPLGKSPGVGPTFDDRIRIIEEDLRGHPWLRVTVTTSRLVADIATGYDVVIMGADKWAQVNDPAWYESTVERDTALARLPTPAIAPRPPFDVPTEHRLDVPAHLLEVSSTAARAGRREWMAPAAFRHDVATRDWTDAEPR